MAAGRYEPVVDIHGSNKAALAAFRRAAYDYQPDAVQRALAALLEPSARVNLAYPLATVTGPEAFLESAYAALHAALPDLERRDQVVIAGEAIDNGAHWVGCAGHYFGTFVEPWLDIPPTGHFAALRYHEFFRFVDGRVAEIQSLWDIPGLMMQAGAWPLCPSLGVDCLAPAPASGDGIVTGPYDEAAAATSARLVMDMLAGLARHAESGVAAMQLERFWHPRFNWYGPAGIGTARGIDGFRRWHQVPFLNAMPDRRALLDRQSHLFADGAYVGFTAWPGMEMTLSGDGWLGIPPSGQRLTMRSLDFWRREGELLRENWVLVDLLDVYHQLGVDVFARMREYRPHSPRPGERL